MLKLMLFTFIALLSSNSFAKSCDNISDDCEYYSCVEEQRHCGKKGYLLGFGKKYCSRFEKMDEKFSSSGKQWIQTVRECLIENLDNYSSSVSCKDFKKAQFKAHVPCYLNAGYCELSRKDRFAVKKVIYKSLWRPSLLWAGMKVILSCKF